MKDLLLAAPVDRFNRFATLLRFDELTQVHKDLMAFCTKPPVSPEAKAFVADIDSLILRVESEPELLHIAKALRKGHKQLSQAKSLIERQAQKLVGSQTHNPELSTALIKMRDETVAAIFSGSVTVVPLTPEEVGQSEQEETTLLELVSTKLTALFSAIVGEATKYRILQEATFYGLGTELLLRDKTVCPS